MSYRDKEQWLKAAQEKQGYNYTKFVTNSIMSPCKIGQGEKIAGKLPMGQRTVAGMWARAGD
jgi:hypothetical protein